MLARSIVNITPLIPKRPDEPPTAKATELGHADPETRANGVGGERCKQRGVGTLSGSGERFCTPQSAISDPAVMWKLAATTILASSSVGMLQDVAHWAE